MFKRLSLALIMVLLSLGFLAVPARAEGATQIAGVGYFDGLVDCTEPVESADGEGPDFALNMTGDLEGCLYVFIETAECTPSGVYLETGTEIYVGSGNEGDAGRFSTTYRVQAKYEDCPTLSGPIHGQCQHPIVEGSGSGDYEGVTGRFDIKDEVEAGNFPYKGHLRWEG